MFFSAAETLYMIRRSVSLLAVLLTVSVSIPIYGQTAESLSGDRLADTLQKLQQRMEALETQNARLESELKLQQQSDISDESEPEESQDSESPIGSEDAPDSLEDLLQATETTDDRLSKIEEGIKKDAEAAKKKKEEDAKKDKKWFEKYTIRGYAQFRVNEVFNNDGPAKAHHVGDSSVGDNQSFLIRRARLVFSGDVSEHLSLTFSLTSPLTFQEVRMPISSLRFETFTRMWLSTTKRNYAFELGSPRFPTAGRIYSPVPTDCLWTAAIH